MAFYSYYKYMLTY